MKKVRTYAVVVSIAAAVGMLSACSDNESDDVADTGAAVETPMTQTPPATAPAPSVTETPPATTPPPAATETPAAPAPEPAQESPGVSGTEPQTE